MHYVCQVVFLIFINLVQTRFYIMVFLLLTTSFNSLASESRRLLTAPLGLQTTALPHRGLRILYSFHAILSEITIFIAYTSGFSACPVLEKTTESMYTKNGSGILVNIYDPSYIRNTLRPLGFTFSKARGQNFLIDADVPRRMAELIPTMTDQTPAGVLEIGPGFGALTEPLLATADKLVAVEVDSRLAGVLKARYADNSRFVLLCEDALRLDLDTLAETWFQGLTPVVAANLPYSITSDLLGALLRATRYKAMLVMIQREVAQRLTANPGTPDYGSFTLYTRVFCECERVFDVAPDVFLPAPAVSSSVVRLIRRSEPLVPSEQQPLFFKLTRASFAQRRKTLRNALSAVFPALGPDGTARCIQNAGLDPGVRGETLDVSDFLRLCGTFDPTASEMQG